MRAPSIRTTWPPSRVIFFSTRSSRGARAASSSITSVARRRTVAAQMLLPPAVFVERHRPQDRSLDPAGLRVLVMGLLSFLSATHANWSVPILAIGLDQSVRRAYKVDTPP